MLWWLGMFLMISGTASLVFNELTMRVRRVWPWRRDDADPSRDARLNEYYRVSVFFGSVACIECGQWLAQLNAAHWSVRCIAYVVFGSWLLWRRPALRQKRFWKSLLAH